MSAQQPVVSADEYSIKVAYIYNFTKFIEWPEKIFKSDTDPFKICILGKSPINEKIFELENNSVNKRKITVIKNNTASCHILFIGKQEANKQSLILEKLKNEPVLTIGESPSFISNGGIINFFIEENKIKFEINNEPAKSKNLIISSRLLKLAKTVEQ